MGEETLAYGQKALSAIAESQAAMARGLEALALEVTGLTRTAVAAAGDSATAMLGARTVAEAVEVQIGFARRSFEAAASGSARLSELCLKLVGDASRPLIAPVTAPGAGADADHGGFRRL
jgi:hypothetical protein